VSEKPTYEELEQRVEQLESAESARRIAEKRLLESEAKFRNIVEISLAGIYIIQAGIFLYVNRKFAEILGYSVEECIGMQFQQTVHSEDRERVREQISRRISGKADSVNYTFRGIRKDGKMIHVEVFGSTIQLAGKSCVSGSILDITERKKVEKDRDQLIVDLQKSLSEVKTLRGFLPICSNCKKIRDDRGYWNQIESYIQEHSDAEFSHSLCPECAKKLYPEFDLYED
jgi:PAS domain S-box-containing protein